MRAFVTGATGFIGSHLVEALVAEGWQVRVLVRRDSARRPRTSAAEAVVGDLQDLASLTAATSGVDAVFHLAARVTDWGPWRDFHAATVVGTRNLLRAAAKSGVDRFVHFSTVNVYDDRYARHHRVLNEDAPAAPPGDRHFGHYARAKAMAEEEVWRFHCEANLPVTVLRPALVYGPRDESVLPRLIDYLRSPLATWIGRGNPVVDPIEVSDVVRCALAAAKCDRAIGRAYNVAPQEEIGVRDFYRALCAAVGIGPPRFTIPYSAVAALTVLVENGARLLKTREPPTLTWAGLSLFTKDRHYDPSRAERELGWRAEISLDHGLRRYADWLNSPADQQQCTHQVLPSDERTASDGEQETAPAYTRLAK